MTEKVFFVSDVESTGPDFARHNMYQLAYVPVLEDGTILPGRSLDLQFATEYHHPYTLSFIKRALGLTLEMLKARKSAIPSEQAMKEFENDITKCLEVTGAKKAIFVSDNLAFDWGFVNTYFHRYCNKNPFGYSGRDIPSFSLGFYGTRGAWKKHRTQAHTHNALDDVMGNAGAVAKMIRDGLKIS